MTTMKNKDLQKILNNYPDDAEIYLFKGYSKEHVKGNTGIIRREIIVPFTNENIAKSFDGKITINPPIY